MFQQFRSLSAPLLVLLVATSAHADFKSFLYHRYLQRLQGVTRVSNPMTRQATFDQRIDPENPVDPRTFKQRYWVNSEYASGPNAPVILVICGEGACSSGDMEGAVADYARQFKAHRVALEHRYYGKSQPFPTLSTENLKFLKTENALKDLAHFQQFAMTQLKLKGKWIATGGSYAGALSAFYRLRYPELVVGSLASSGPVHAKADFEEYDLQVATAAGPECAAVMRKVSQTAEDALADPEKLSELKAQFDSEAIKDPVDFLYIIADMGATAVQYGFRDSFCKALQTSADPVDAYAKQGLQLFSRFGTTPVQDSTQGSESLNPDDYPTIGARAWTYQSCTDFGFWQIAYHDPAVSVRSPKIDLAYHNAFCQRLYGLSPVDPTRMNHAFYEPLLLPETRNILFTNGSTDPWAKLSISEELGNNINPNTAVFTIQGAAHCGDLSGASSDDSASMKTARQTFGNLATDWLR